MSDRAKTILIVQHQMDQAELWRSIFESQGCITVVAPPQPEMLALVAQIVPDLLIVDITSGLFNPFALCRDCRSRFPDLSVILTHQVGRPIEDAERRWALYQGATDMMSGIADARAAVGAAEQVYRSAGWAIPVDGEALNREMARIGMLPPPEGDPHHTPPAYPDLPTQPIRPEPNQNSVNRTSSGRVTPKPQLMYRGRPLRS